MSPKCEKKTRLLFIPDSLKLSSGGFLHGTYREFEDSAVFYVTKDTLNNKKSVGDFVGYVKSSDNETIPFLNSLNEAKHDNLVKIVYNYHSFSQHEPVAITEHGYGTHIKILCEELFATKTKKHSNSSAGNLQSILITFLTLFLNLTGRIHEVFRCSATFSHFNNNLNDFVWFLKEYKTQKRLTPKLGNLLVSKLCDITLGIFLWQYFLENAEFINELLDNGREAIIDNFKNLLTYLMGSPIGLKLNYSFNRSLGTFFFYHISLWKIFLIAMQPLVQTYLPFLVLPGAFGFSYQIAMISDIISIATFHLYCIYVYAARLTSLQLRGLLSLWRLFIGRKHNPLRQRVDSCNYTHNQLFIGTLAFTVFLFLLPTTAMYYAVFTSFRLLVLVLNRILKTTRNSLHSLPFYLIWLWMIKSPQITGPVHFSYVQENIFRCELEDLSLWQCIKTFTYIQRTKSNEIKKLNTNNKLLYNVFSGTLV